MRDAQSALDQVISFAGEKIETEDVEKALGIAGADLLARVINGIAENQPAEALAIVDDIVMRGHNLRNFCRDVLGHLRDLLIVKVAGDPKLLDSSAAITTMLQQQAALFSESDLVRFFHSLAETEASLKDAANPRYQVEVGLVKLMEMRRLRSLGDLVERISELESALRTGKPPAERKAPPAASGGSTQTPAGRAKASAASTGSAQAATAESIEAAPPPSKPASESLIDQIKSSLEQKRRRLLIAALDAASRAALEGDELVLEFAAADKQCRDTLAKTENAGTLREACIEVLGREIGIRLTIKANGDDDGEPLSPAEADRRDKERARKAAEKDPVVQQVLRAFGGEIVDIKMQ